MTVAEVAAWLRSYDARAARLDGALDPLDAQHADLLRRAADLDGRIAALHVVALRLAAERDALVVEAERLEQVRACAEWACALGR